MARRLDQRRPCARKYDGNFRFDVKTFSVITGHTTASPAVPRPSTKEDPMHLSKCVSSLSALALVAAAACSHAQPAAEEKPAQPQAAAPAQQPAPAPQARQPDAADGQAELDRAMQQLRDVSVFFEFDSATLTQEARESLSQVGSILARHADLKVRIEGNCDERGSEQYNLALGQRRAESA